MAITITSEPQNYSTASNPVVFEFSSTNTAEEGFSFLVELTVNGSIHSFHQVFTESNNFGKFDASEILRTIVFSDLSTSGNYVETYDNSNASYSIRVIEKYGTPPIEVGSWVSSTSLRIMNGALRFIDWLDYDYTDYDVTTYIDNSPLFLSAFPRTSQYFCGLTESAFVGFISTDTTASIRVRIYDVNDVQTATDSTSITLPTSNIVLLNGSPQSIIDNTSIVASDFDDCYYYTLNVRATGAGGFSGDSEFWRIYLDNECSQYTSRRLHWVNKFGMWESYSFTKYSEENTQVDSNKYQKNPGVWSDSNTFDYNRENGSQFSGTKTATDTMILNSDWIKEEKHNWLMRSLMESPSVYLEISQGVFEPVTISTKKYKLKQRIREGLIQEKIEVLRTYTYKSQLN